MPNGLQNKLAAMRGINGYTGRQLIAPNTSFGRNANTQSWFDLPYGDPVDPRSVISAISFDDNTGVAQPGLFQNSATFLHNTTWQASPLALSAGTGATAPFCAPVTPADYLGISIAQRWQNSHGIIRSNTQLPPTVQKIIYTKAYPRFQTAIFFDWAGGVTSSDLQFSFRDNSAVGGNFITGAATVPVFAWNGPTFGGSARKLIISTVRPGRFVMVLRIVDNAGNWSMFEIELRIVE